MNINADLVEYFDTVLMDFAKVQTPTMYRKGQITLAMDGDLRGVIPTKGTVRFSAARKQNKLADKIDRFRTSSEGAKR